ncbi:Udp-glycosyltransferase 85a8 [Thalictrum thalictroides]|uniref:Glycosyltransferase n=1 Tax=Thalictrum thalictroides TaxID=46969 RepID=A0A7J6W5H8_THATH|nr:Udp-glycosyltransferase 85a8 [Thalictrum thalictroides]
MQLEREEKMECNSVANNSNKPHAVLFPFPFQSHINAMLKLAKLLHCKGFQITFVNTEFNHQKLLNSRGPDSLKGFRDFSFETIPDGLISPSDVNAIQEIPALWQSITSNCLVPLRNLITRLNNASASGDPSVSCIVADALLSATLVEVAEEFAIPGVLLWSMSASVLMSYLYYQDIAENVLFPLKEEIKEHINMPINLIPGMRDIRLRDLPSFFWDGKDFLNDLALEAVKRFGEASAIIITTFDALEREVIIAMKSLLPGICTIGPLQLLEQPIPNNQLRSLKSNLWKEDSNCLKWLDSKQPNSVVYVNFGSTTVMSSQQLIEFAWGLANSKHPFLWVIRPDLVIGEAAVLPAEFTEETADRGIISGWCPQEQVLCHSSTAGFLTHSGWNSTMDTICGGVPILSWPFFGDQTMNCRCACVHWGIGMEIDNNVKRDEVEVIVRELMEGEKGKRMMEKAMEWKKSAEEATKPGGSSYVNLDKLIKDVLLLKKQV